MEESYKVKLESGADLEIQPADWIPAKKLLKVVLAVTGDIRIRSGDDLPNTVKDLLAKLLSSEAVEHALEPCMGRALYRGQRITEDIWEDPKARGDYLVVAKEVLWFNLRPFTQSLASLFAQILGNVLSFQKSGSTESKTNS